MIILAAAYALPAPATARAGEFLREDFNSLDRWEPLLFPRIKKHSRYSIVREGDDSFLLAVSQASASGLSLRETFSIYDYPRIRWRWKAMGTYEKGNAAIKSGDDYLLRIYVVFPYDPAKVGFGEKIKYNAARIIYGEEPPPRAGLAIMNDADDTGEGSVSYIDFIEVYR